MVEENKEIVKFDPSSVVDKVRTKIREQFVDLIPDEQWNQMIQGEIKDFMELKRPDYNQQRDVSGLRIIVRRMLEEEVKNRVNAILESKEWSSQWAPTPPGSANHGSYGHHAASEKITTMLKENGAEILNMWLSNAFQGVLAGLRQR